MPNRRKERSVGLGPDPVHGFPSESEAPGVDSHEANGCVADGRPASPWLRSLPGGGGSRRAGARPVPAAGRRQFPVPLSSSPLPGGVPGPAPPRLGLAVLPSPEPVRLLPVWLRLHAILYAAPIHVLPPRLPWRRLEYRAGGGGLPGQGASVAVLAQPFLCRNAVSAGQQPLTTGQNGPRVPGGTRAAQGFVPFQGAPADVRGCAGTAQDRALPSSLLPCEYGSRILLSYQPQERVLGPARCNVAPCAGVVNVALRLAVRRRGLDPGRDGTRFHAPIQYPAVSPNSEWNGWLQRPASAPSPGAGRLVPRSLLAQLAARLGSQPPSRERADSWHSGWRDPARTASVVAGVVPPDWETSWRRRESVPEGDPP
jgi:hypothetical protein